MKMKISFVVTSTDNIIIHPIEPFRRVHVLAFRVWNFEAENQIEISLLKHFCRQLTGSIIFIVSTSFSCFKLAFVVAIHSWWVSHLSSIQFTNQISANNQISNHNLHFISRQCFEEIGCREMTVWFPKSTLSKSGPHPKQTRMNLSQNENLNRVPIIQNSKNKTRKILTRQQTMSVNVWSLKPRLFFFRLDYSIKYFVRSFISSMELDFREFVIILALECLTFESACMVYIEFISLSCISGSRSFESYLSYIPLSK